MSEAHETTDTKVSEREQYLGDGLYASFDGFTMWLRAPREDGDHKVALEPQVFAAFLAFAFRCGFAEIIGGSGLRVGGP